MPPRTYHVGAANVSAEDGDGATVVKAPNSAVPILRGGGKERVVGRDVNVVDNPRMAPEGANQHGAACRRHGGVAILPQSATVVAPSGAPRREAPDAKDADQVIVGACDEVTPRTVKAEAVNGVGQVRVDGDRVRDSAEQDAPPRAGGPKCRSRRSSAPAGGRTALAHESDAGTAFPGQQVADEWIAQGLARPESVELLLRERVAVMPSQRPDGIVGTMGRTFQLRQLRLVVGVDRPQRFALALELRHDAVAILFVLVKLVEGPHPGYVVVCVAAAVPHRMAKEQTGALRFESYSSLPLERQGAIPLPQLASTACHLLPNVPPRPDGRRGVLPACFLFRHEHQGPIALNSVSHGGGSFGPEQSGFDPGG